MKFAFVFLVLTAACGGSKPTPTATPTPTPAPATATTPPAAKPTIGPDQCCCPFASAEGVEFNISPKKACEDAGVECVDDASCTP
ncbi:MAG: hypothetical protein NT062_33725 [Proteobacteria bacterium]|nr:hypothetical protein [Pseudomonadota bacterium]